MMTLVCLPYFRAKLISFLQIAHLVYTYYVIKITDLLDTVSQLHDAPDSTRVKMSQ